MTRIPQSSPDVECELRYAIIDDFDELLEIDEDEHDVRAAEALAIGQRVPSRNMD
jgi:hypothetical protein